MTDKAFKPPTEAAMAMMGNESLPAGVVVCLRSAAVGWLLRRSGLDLVIMSRWVGFGEDRDQWIASNRSTMKQPFVGGARDEMERFFPQALHPGDLPSSG